GKETGKKVTLPEGIFQIEPNDHAIYLDVKQYLANKRQGTHKAKQRNEVSGTTKKLKKQKGTGGARAGSMKSPVFIGGGRIFGPVPRDYSFKLNKKVKALARISALTYKAKENSISILETFSLDEPKTKEYISILGNLALGNKKTLLILPEKNDNIILSGRNLQRAKITTVDQLNTYDVVNADNILLFEGSVQKLESLLA
ncbi:MAG TPA: 50S ribosomal protein L4, partial [Cytophagaceae bacterium]